MFCGANAVMDSTHQPHVPLVSQTGAAPDYAWDEVRASLRNLRYGSVTIIVQDGVIIQIDRTEKRRLQSRRANQRGQ
jgi:hypothetical protein